MAETLTEKIYQAVRDDIVNLRIKPGEKLSEAKLAQEYGVSRAPIRAVIQKLAQDELVRVKPQVGTIVVPISQSKAKDILQIRMLLECYAAEQAALKAEPEVLAELGTKLAELADLPDDSEEKREVLFATDSLLHQTIWRLCGNQEIAHIITNYKDETQRIRLSTLELANRLTPSEREMKHIFQCLQKRDPQAANQAMQTHIQNIMNAMDQALRQNPDAEINGGS